MTKYHTKLPSRQRVVHKSHVQDDGKIFQVFSISAGDLCDTDINGDGVVNTVDNCVYLSNTAQTD